MRCPSCTGSVIQGVCRGCFAVATGNIFTFYSDEEVANMSAGNMKEEDFLYCGKCELWFRKDKYTASSIFGSVYTECPKCSQNFDITKKEEVKNE